MQRVFKTSEFDEDFEKLEKSEKERVEKILTQISEKGNLVGKTLRFDFLREKKFDGKRLYFLLYNEINAILIVGVSDKKAQQETINQIIMNLNAYKEFVYTMLKEETT